MVNLKSFELRTEQRFIVPGARFTGFKLLQFSRGKQAHPQQQQAVAEPADVGAAIRTFLVVDRDFRHLQAQPAGAEDQGKVTERIKVAEVVALVGQSLVVAAEEYFGAAERVFEPLAEQPREHQTEKLIAEDV